MTRKLLPVVALITAIVAAPAVALALPADDDILDMASGLQSKSSELQKVQADLKDRREEVKKEAAVVKEEKKKVDDMKAAANSDNDPGPLEGPFYLFTGAYSNSQTNKHGGEAEAFGGKPQGGEEIQSLAAAHAKAMKHMSGNNQPTFRIEDKNGKIIENTGRSLSASRIENPSAPKPDNSATAAADAALASRQSASEQAVQKYLADKAAYDKSLAAYNADVDKLNQSLPTAMQEIGTPTPSADQMGAPKGDYQVGDLGTLAAKKGQTVKDGSATSFVQEAAKLPDPTQWGQGAKVTGTAIPAGTPIATFKEGGKFTPGPGSHTAVYVTQNKKGIWVYDQYKTATGLQRPLDTRFIRFKNGAGNPSNDASSYSVIKKAVQPPPPPPPR